MTGSVMGHGASARVVTRAAVAYLRTSDDSSTLPLEAQRQAIAAWSTRERVPVAAWQLDVGVSGFAPIAERPGLISAYRALREHDAGVLVAATAERFAHDNLVAWLIEREALVHGAMVCTADASAADASALPDGTDGAWTRGAIDLARAYQRVVVRSRTRAALAAKKARGERVGALPYGQRLAEDGVHLEVDPAEQAILMHVRRLAGEGLSQRAIVAHLAARGVTGRTGAPLQQTQIARMLVRAL